MGATPMAPAIDTTTATPACRAPSTPLEWEAVSRQRRALAPSPVVLLSQEGANVRTYSPKASEISRQWHVVDAEGLVLGRMATEVARVLRGKHKPTFASHLDSGDHVIIINAEKVLLTRDKGDKKDVFWHSGFPGGIKHATYAALLATKPEEAVRRTIRGMIPHNRLGRATLKKLKVYAGPEHPHSAQAPQPLIIDHARSRA
jgi:large subunit ribosomal protein L13